MTQGRWSRSRPTRCRAAVTSQSGMPVPPSASCSPQAWASAARLLFLRTLLRLEPSVPDGMLAFAPARSPNAACRRGFPGYRWERTCCRAPWIRGAGIFTGSRVLRDRVVVRITKWGPAAELVPGDIVAPQAGDSSCPIPPTCPRRRPANSSMPSAHRDPASRRTPYPDLCHSSPRSANARNSACVGGAPSMIATVPGPRLTRLSVSSVATTLSARGGVREVRKHSMTVTFTPVCPPAGGVRRGDTTPRPRCAPILGLWSRFVVNAAPIVA